MRLAVLMVALVFILWLNATKFDKTEIQTILTMFFVAAGAEGLPRIFGRDKK